MISPKTFVELLDAYTVAMTNYYVGRHAQPTGRRLDEYKKASQRLFNAVFGRYPTQAELEVFDEDFAPKFKDSIGWLVASKIPESRQAFFHNPPENGY